jgi:CHASE1-domain containing sensor protein
VTYIAEMNERNGPTLGFDVYSEAVRRATMDRAIQRRQ